MAYTRIRDDSPPTTTHDEQEKFHGWEFPEKFCFFTYRTLFGLVLALWIATSAALGWALFTKTEVHTNHGVDPLPFPRVPSRIVTFNPDASFRYIADDTGESAWSSLMPNDGGIVAINQAQEFHLPASYMDRKNSHAQVYSMSMFHQLHCLNSIRVRLGTLEGYINATSTEMHHGKRNIFAQESHVDHCFDYMRQAIMCAGDLSLEHSVVPEEFGFNGWGTAHQCADWDTMWDIAVERRYDQSAAQENKGSLTP